MRQERLPVNQEAVDEGGANVGEPEESVDLVSKTFEELLPVTPADDEETKDELECETPDHVSPDYVAPVLGEQCPKSYDNNNATRRYETVP